MLVGRAREAEDYTRDKSDDKDAVLIARLVAQLHCYAPERADETWARLRQLGARRERLITEATAAYSSCAICSNARGRGCCSPRPSRSSPPTGVPPWRWCSSAAMAARNDCPARSARFEAAVRRELPRWGGSRRRRAIIEAVFVALVDPTGVMTQRRGALERARWVLADWRAATTRLAEVETRMVEVLDELGLTEYVTSIPGVSAVGAAAMLAETGDPARFDSPRALVKHAGLCPRDNASGTFTGRSRISRRGRPGLRLAAWRAVWGALAHNPVMAARYQH